MLMNCLAKREKSSIVPSEGSEPRSFRPPLLVGFPEGYQVLYAPESIRNASGHRGRHAKCTMNFCEVVDEIVEGSRSRAIFDCGLARPAVNEFLRQFFSEHFDASLRSLQPNGLAASDPKGLWNEVRICWP